VAVPQLQTKMTRARLRTGGGELGAWSASPPSAGVSLYRVRTRGEGVGEALDRQRRCGLKSLD
jgi:hypothetical protein